MRGDTKPRILVAEDNDVILEIMEIMLKDKYDLVTATNGKDAVDLYINFRPDIVLMDIIMPKMSGARATEEIRKFDQNAKIIGITGYDTERGEGMIKAGALDIIQKPFTRKKLIETIEKYLNDKGVTDDI